MTEVIARKSRNIPDGKELFEGISGNFKDFGQTLCELTDNAISNFRAHNIRGFIEIMLVSMTTMQMSRSATTAQALRTWTQPSPLPPVPAPSPL